MPAPARAKPTPRKPAPPATPTVAKKAAPKNEPLPRLEADPTGGAGADVANVKIEGVEFTDGAYLNNIVRQIAVASIRAIRAH
jgi:hypothetical protein